MSTFRSTGDPHPTSGGRYEPLHHAYEHDTAEPIRVSKLKRKRAAAGDQGDGGAADALRYLVATNPRIVTQCRLRAI